MFEDTLLDSSAKSAPILTTKHWFISIAIGAVVFLAGYFGLPMLSANDTQRDRDAIGDCGVVSLPALP